jgi:hypothetical protein
MSFLRDDAQGACFVAEAFAVAGRTDEALEWLGHAVESGFKNYPMLSERDPFLATLRGEPRFEKLLASVKAEWEALAP